MVFMPHWPQIIGKKPINMGLERVVQVLEELGNPHLNLPPVVHVAGTNGKGSTLAFMRSFLEYAGYKVHLYTSPHLLNFNERIKLCGTDISDQLLYQVMERCRIAAGNIPITFFEGTTVGAFLAFAENPADIVLLETGLGGRLDATNVVPHPALTVITPISLDHTEYLGPNIRFIAREKAGILKSGAPCISSIQRPEANDIIFERAQEVGVEVFAFEYDWIIEKTDNSIRYKSQDRDIELPLPNLIGDHQIINAGTAIAALEHLKKFSISHEAYKEGIQNVVWPGRLQQLTKGQLVSMLPDQWELWIDGAHNDSAAHVLSQLTEQWDDKPLYIICGMTKNRDAKSFLSHFKDKTKFIGGITVETEPSAHDGSVIANAATALGINTKAFKSIDEGIHYLISQSSTPARILCCGSLYLMSDVFKANSTTLYAA